MKHLALFEYHLSRCLFLESLFYYFWRNLLLLSKSSSSHNCDSCKICVNMWQSVLSLFHKKRKTSSKKNHNQCGKLHLDATHFVKLFTSLFSSHKYPPFPFCIFLEIGVQVYNLESDEYFSIDICWSLCQF